MDNQIIGNTDIQTVEASDEIDKPQVPEKFVVTDADSANWVVKKIIECRVYRDRVDAWAAREKKRALHDEEFFVRWFGRQLQDWAREQIEKLKGRRKSLNLPAGTLAFRRENSRLVVDDDKLVIEWARKACPVAIQMTEKLVRTAVKEHFEATGEMPDNGAHVEPEKETFSIK